MDNDVFSDKQEQQMKTGMISELCKNLLYMQSSGDVWTVIVVLESTIGT